LLRGRLAGLGATADLHHGLLAEPTRLDADWAAVTLAALLISPLGWSYYVWLGLWPVAAVIAEARPWRRRAPADAWLLLGLGGWLWWGHMTEWGQPHPAATLTAASMYVWALAALWIWVQRQGRSAVAAPVQ
jgi:hypothetical protein